MYHQDAIATLTVAVCLLLISYFSLAETALENVSRSRVVPRDRPEIDDASADASGGGAASSESDEAARRLRAVPARVAAAVQTGLTLFSLIAVSVSVAALAPDLAAWLRRALHLRHDYPAAVALLVAVVALLVLSVGEIVPRAFGLQYPEQTERFVSGSLRWVERIERPVVALVLGFSNLLVRPFGLSASFQAPVITEVELRTILDTSTNEGVIEADEQEMLHNVISFGDTLVHKVMTPRVHVVALSADQSVTRLVHVIVDHGHSRIPIYEGTIDTVIGVVHAKDLLPSLVRGEPASDLRTLMRAPLFVPEQMRTDELLEQMRSSNRQIAIVQDEYGGTAGLVTVEDLLEEIVGEIRDEYDVEQSLIAREPDGSYLVDARMAIDDVNHDLGLTLPTTDFDTIGGYVFGLFGRPPLTGDAISAVDGSERERDVRFAVTEADGRRLQQLRIVVQPAQGAAATVPEVAGHGGVGA